MLPAHTSSLIGRRVGVIRLHRGHDPESGEARDVGRVTVSMCSTRWRRSRSRAGFAAAARSYASRAIRIPASPMAWISICQPRRSASATKASSVSASHSGRPVEVSSTYGSSIAAVRASMTPSAKALRMPASSHSPPRRSPTSVSYPSSVAPQSPSVPPGLHRQREPSPHRQRAFVEEGSPERDLLRFDPSLLDRR